MASVISQDGQGLSKSIVGGIHFPPDPVHVSEGQSIMTELL